MNTSKIILSFLFSGLFSLTVFAQTTTFTASSGNWNAPANWSNGVPTSTVNAIIGAGNICTINTNGAECASLTLNGSNGETQLTVSSGRSLSVGGAISVAAPTSGNKLNSIMVEGELSAASLTLANSSNDNRDVRLIVSGGVVTITGNITMNGSASRNEIQFNTTGTVKVGGTLSGGTITASSGTMEFTSGGAQTIPATYTYNNLTISGAGTKTLGGSEVINNLNILAGALSVGSNSLTVSGTTSISGSFIDNNASGTLLFTGLVNIGATGVWNISAAQPVELRGGITNSGTFTSGTGTYSFTTNNQSIGGTLVFNGGVLMTTASRSITNNGNVTVNGNLEAWNNTNEWINATGSTLTAAQDLLVTGVLTATASNNTVVYNNSGTRVAKGTTYHHLTKSGAGSLTLNALTVNGNLTVNAGTFDASAYSVNIDCNGNVAGSGGEIKFAYSSFYIGGDVTYSGTLTIPNAEVYYDGGSQSVRATTYFNLYIAGSGDKTISGNVTASNLLNIASGRKLAINGYTLNIGGQLSGAGTITGSTTSSLSLTGNSFDLSINMDQASSASRSLQNLTINNPWRTITLGNAMEVTGTVTVSNGTLASGGNLTLISNASGTARVATLPLTQGSGITGNVTVQKYVAAGSSRRWLQVASPVSGFTWNQLLDDIYITGPLGNGWDVNQTKNHSAQTYTESVSGDCGPNGWSGAPSAGSSVATGVGLKVFFRGDRSNASRLNPANPPAPNATTLDFNGAINSGAQNLNITYTNHGNSSWDGWNFVANPYPSDIDWNAASGWTKTNVSGTIYVWNAQSGVYATWNGASGTNGLSNGRIAMGQGFWVKATAASPVLSMTESVKTATSATGFFKTDQAITSTFRLRMVQDSIVFDDVVFNFDAAFDRSYQRETGDALKLVNSSINIWSVSSDNENLVINNYPTPQTTDTVVLGMTSSTGGIFTLQFSTDSIPSNILVYLIDEFRGRVIDVRKEKSWRVLINADPKSYALGRLKLVFSNVGTTTWTASAKGDEATKKSRVEWNSNQEVYTARYEVQHSTDSVQFNTLHVVQLNDTLLLNPSSYYFLHQNPAMGVNFYRVARYNIKGEVDYSNVQTVVFNATTTGVTYMVSGNYSLYPVPAVNQLNLTAVNPKQIQAVEHVAILNMTGQEMKGFSYTQNKNAITFNISGLPAGTYIIQLTNFDGKVSSIKFNKSE